MPVAEERDLYRASFDRFARGRTFGKTNSHSPWV